MVPTGFDGENTVLGAPEGYPDIEPLSVCRCRINDLPFVISCWKMTAEELAEIKRTGRVWLYILGDTMPPAVVDGSNPFQN